MNENKINENKERNNICRDLPAMFSESGEWPYQCPDDQEIARALNIYKEIEENGSLTPPEKEKVYKVSVDENKQLTIPAELVKRLGLNEALELEIVEWGNKIEICPSIHCLNKLYIEPTSRCNLNCLTCIRETWNEPLGFMDIKTFNRLIEQLKEFRTIQTVMFGGFGEPTFHPDIVYMISSVKSLGLKAEMVTNGTLLNEDLARSLIESGLDTLWVSFDGTSSQSFEDIREGANFEALIGKLKRFKKLNRQNKHKVNVGIAFVVTKKNINDLSKLGQLANNIGAGKISVSNVIPYSKEMLEQMVCNLGVEKNNRILHYGSVEINIPLIDKTELTKQALFDLFRYYNNISIMKNKVGAKTGSCAFIRERCSFVRWDGEVAPCMGLLHSHKTYFNTVEVERSVRNYSLGNIKENTLKKIWESREYCEFREKVAKFDFAPCLQCGPCELAEKNEEDCFGNSFPTCGGCLWGQGVIQCP